MRNVTQDLSEAKYIFIAIYNGAVWALITCFLVFTIDGLTSSEIQNFTALGVTITEVATQSYKLTGTDTHKGQRTGTTEADTQARTDRTCTGNDTLRGVHRHRAHTDAQHTNRERRERQRETIQK